MSRFHWTYSNRYTGRSVWTWFNALYGVFCFCFLYSIYYISFYIWSTNSPPINIMVELSKYWLLIWTHPQNVPIKNIFTFFIDFDAKEKNGAPEWHFCFFFMRDSLLHQMIEPVSGDVCCLVVSLLITIQMWTQHYFDKFFFSTDIVSIFRYTLMP